MSSDFFAIYTIVRIDINKTKIMLLGISKALNCIMLIFAFANAKIHVPKIGITYKGDNPKILFLFLYFIQG